MAADLESNTQSDDLENDVQIDEIDDELEQYGIWVKVGPEDVEQTEPDGDPDGEFGLESLSGDEMDGDALLTEEEEQLLGSLEDGSTDFEPPDNFGVGEDDFPDEMPAEDFLSDDLEDEDFGVEDLPEEDFQAEDLTEDEPLAEELTDDELTGEDLGELSELSLDDFEEEASNEILTDDDSDGGLSPEDELGNLSDLELDDDIPEIGLDGDLVDLDSDLKIPNMDEEADVFEMETAEEVLPGADDGLNNIELDEMEEVDGEEDLVELELDTDAAGETEDFASDLGLDSLDAALETPGAIPDDMPSDLPEDIDELLPEVPEVLEEQVDDVASLEMALREDDSPALEEHVSGSSDLEKIEKDLASIKEELSTLKNELSLLKQAPQFADEPGEDSSGFFVEEEDETIALTGDELDNILNTADITEETVEESEVPDDDDLIDFPVDDSSMELNEELPVEESDSDLLIDKEDVIPLEAEEPADIDDIDLEEPEADAAVQTETINLDESDELLGEILPEDDDLLDEGVVFDTEPADLDFEPIELESDDFEQMPEAEEFDIEELSIEEPVEELMEESGVDMVLDEVSEPDFALEEILDEEIEEPHLEELEIDLDAGMSDDLEEIEAGVDLVDLDGGAVEDAAEDDLLELEEIEPELPAVEEVQELGFEPDIAAADSSIPDGLKDELRSVLSYMDHLLESLPEDKIQEFAQSEHFETYKKLFEELGLEL